ncbi:MAG: hypothetical protein OET90_01940 [Desulfuromonadales bacterium]|nr:hypothetical protein [Desulfuromonadales bacterium]
MRPPLLLLALLCTVLLATTACVHRIAPLSPHRSNTQDHAAAKANSDCVECHQIAELGKGHQASDNCLRCHRILQGG